MSENKTDSSPKLSEAAQRLIEERESKPEEEKSLLWDTSLYDLENDPKLLERWKAECLKYLEAHPEEVEKVKKGIQKVQTIFFDLAEEVKKGIQSVQVSLSDWPAFPKERLFGGPSASAREAWEFYRRVMAEDEVRGWHLLKEHEQWYSDQIKAAEKEAKKWKSHREMRSRISLAKIQYFIKRLVLRRFTRQYMMFLTVPGELSQEEAEEIISGVGGRKLTIDDPSAYSVETLNALLEWTADEANKGSNFRGKDSLCGFIAQRLEPHANHKPPQSTIRSRLESLMESLNVNLPHGSTNALSYFKARDQIKKAMKTRGLLG